MSSPLNFLNHKISKLSDEELVNECIKLLRKMESNTLTSKDKELAPIFFTKATERDTLEFVRNDFLIALKVLKYL
jgi:hypothetical protein